METPPDTVNQADVAQASRAELVTPPDTVNSESGGNIFISGNRSILFLIDVEAVHLFDDNASALNSRSTTTHVSLVNQMIDEGVDYMHIRKRMEVFLYLVIFFIALPTPFKIYYIAVFCQAEIARKLNEEEKKFIRSLIKDKSTEAAPPSSEITEVTAKGGAIPPPAEVIAEPSATPTPSAEPAAGEFHTFCCPHTFRSLL
jgi:hypothetical protein